MRSFLASALAFVALVGGASVQQAAAQSVQYAQAVVRNKLSLGYNINGIWAFTTLDSGLVQINITVSGLQAGSYATHIHTYGDISTGVTGNIDTAATGTVGVGSHFNPLGAAGHSCYPSTNRHVGDIGNITVTGPEQQSIVLVRDLLSLTSTNSLASIIGRGVIVHSTFDNCQAAGNGNAGTPIAQGVVGIVDPVKHGFPAGTTNAAYNALAAEPNSLMGVFRQLQPAINDNHPVAGFIQMGWNAVTSKVRVVAKISGLTQGSSYGIHVHTFGDDSDMDGMFASGHYDPNGAAVHALPPATPHHMGDMGNLACTADHYTADGICWMDAEFDLLRITPVSTASPAEAIKNIVGRGVILHQLFDQGTPNNNGAAGTRYGIAVLGISNRLMPVDTSSSSTGAVGPTVESSSGAANGTTPITPGNPLNAATSSAAASFATLFGATIVALLALRW